MAGILMHQYKTLTRSFRTFSATKTSHKKKHLTSSRHARSPEKTMNSRADNRGPNMNENWTRVSSILWTDITRRHQNTTACSLPAKHQSYYITSCLPSLESAHYSKITRRQKSLSETILRQLLGPEVVCTKGLY